jgi:hypothetical protein
MLARLAAPAGCRPRPIPLELHAEVASVENEHLDLGRSFPDDYDDPGLALAHTRSISDCPGSIPEPAQANLLPPSRN